MTPHPLNDPLAHHEWLLTHAIARLRAAIPDARVICSHEAPLAPVYVMLPGKEVIKWHPAAYAAETWGDRLRRWARREPRPFVFKAPFELHDEVIAAMAGSFTRA